MKARKEAGMIDIIKHYDAILDDLSNQRAEIDRMIEDVRKQKQFAVLRAQSSSQIVQATAPATHHDEKTSFRVVVEGAVTLVSGAEAVLRRKGSPMHASDIVTELGEMGKQTTVRSLNSTLLQDSKARFTAYGQNVFGLAEWDQDKEIEAQELKKVIGGNSISIGDALEQAIRKAGHAMPVADLMAAIREFGITSSSNSIRATLSQDKRFIRVDAGIYGLAKMKQDIQGQFDLDKDANNTANGGQ